MQDEPLNKEQIEPSSPLPINTMGSGSVNIPPGALEASRNTDIPVSLNNTNPENTPVLTENPEVTKPAESGSAEAENLKIEPISEPAQISETRTAQIPPNEPFENTQDKPLAHEPEPIKQEPVSSSGSSEVKQEVKFESVSVPIPVILPLKNSIRELLAKAKNAIQFRKRKKLDKVMAMFLKQSKITNDEVEKFLHVSDATATRYLSQLEKENKIKQVGKTGHAVSYSRI